MLCLHFTSIPALITTIEMLKTRFLLQQERYQLLFIYACESKDFLVSLPPEKHL